MSPSELDKAGKRLFGRAWKPPMADALGVSVSTVRRWATGAVLVPGPAIAALACLQKRKLP